MLTSGLATSEFTSSQYIETDTDTENQSNLSPRKYFILNCKLIYILYWDKHIKHNLMEEAYPI